MPHYDSQPSVGMTSERQTPELENVHTRLAKCNNEFSSPLHEVEEKLHKILNKRSPENAAKEGALPQPNDYISAVGVELNAYERNNLFLSRLLSHLSQIS